MIDLPQVTLVCMTGVNYKIKEHQEALRKSCEGIEFGKVLYIINPFIKNIDDWNKAIIYDLPKYIETEFALLIHNDGYVINSNCWNDDWLNYDYIGAPWPLPMDDFSYRSRDGQIQRVGNSVSLRSKKLLDVANRQKLPWKAFNGFTNEDGFICVNYRHIYEQEECKFAPLEVAVYFSKEHEIPENKNIKTFCFHSI